RAFDVSLSEIRDLMRERERAHRLLDLLLRRRRQLVELVRENELRLADLDEWVQSLDRGQAAPSYAVVLTRTAPSKIAMIRKSIASYSGAAELFDELQYHVRRRRGHSGAPAAIWHTCGDSGGPIDCEAFTVIKQPISGAGYIRVEELRPNLVASIIHQGR